MVLHFEWVSLSLVNDINLEGEREQRGEGEKGTLWDKSRQTVFSVPKNICCALTPEFPTISKVRGVPVF